MLTLGLPIVLRTAASTEPNTTLNAYTYKGTCVIHAASDCSVPSRKDNVPWSMHGITGTSHLILLLWISHRAKELGEWVVVITPPPRPATVTHLFTS